MDGIVAGATKQCVTLAWIGDRLEAYPAVALLAEYPLSNASFQFSA